LKPAPEIGEWFVITTEARYFHIPPEEQKFELVVGSSQPVSDKFDMNGTAEPFKHRCASFQYFCVEY
jgi:hypothetical protein